MSKAKTFAVGVPDGEINFKVDVPTYEKYINELGLDNKVAPGKTFLRRCVEPDSKELLEKWIEAGYAMEIAEQVIEGVKPKVEFTLKK